MPKHGPREGSRSATQEFLPIFRRPWASAIEVVVLPEPAGMPEVAVIRISLPWGFFEGSSLTFALSRP